MGKLLTVVVPAYNAERYLKTNLDSLCQKEVLKELEVLVINDGSIDSTGEIAEACQRSYPGTVRVIHKENGGHGSGINTGIREATGKYFKVVDADDWVDRAAFLNLIGYLKTADSDMVISGFYWVYDDGSDNIEGFKRKAEIHEPFKGVVYKKAYRFDDIAAKIYVKMHGLTIRTSILKEHEIRIDEHCFYVDTEYILYPVPYTETVSFIEDFVYMYRIGRSGQSVSPERMLRNQADYDKVMKSLTSFYGKCKKNEIPCSEEKLRYIAGGIARVAAGKVKILLSMPAGKEVKQELMQFERSLKAECPEVYEANQNKAVWALRKSGYLLYPIAAKVLRRRIWLKLSKIMQS